VPTYDINLNLTDKSSGSGPAATNKNSKLAIDEKAFNGLTRALEKVLHDQSKQITAGLKSAVVDALKSANASKKDTGQAEIKINQSAIARALKASNDQVGQSIALQIKKAIESKPAAGPKSIDDKAISDAIKFGVSDAAGKIQSAIKSELKMSRSQASFTDLTSSIESAISKGLSKGGQDKSTVELVRVLSGVRDSLKRIDFSANKITTATSSGSKTLNTRSIEDLLKSISRINTEIASLGVQVNNAKKSIAELGKINVDEFFKSVTGTGGVRAAVKTKLAKSDVASSIDSKAIGDTLAASIVKHLSGAKLGGNKDLEVALKKFADSLKGFSDIAPALNKLANDLKPQKETSEAREIIKKLSDIESRLSRFPSGRELGTGSLPKALGAKAAEVKKDIITPTGALVQKIKLIVDDSELKKIEKKPLEVEVELKPDKKPLKEIESKSLDVSVKLDAETREFYSSLKKAIDAAITQMGKATITPNVKPVMDKLVQLRAEIDDSSLKDIVSKVEAIRQSKTIEFGIDIDSKSQYKLNRMKEALEDLTTDVLIKTDMDLGSVNLGKQIKDIKELRSETQKLNTEQAL
jgi:hypothetical protein